jgi:hypothetical protein
MPYRNACKRYNNPVRRGLGAKPEDGLWSGAAEYAGVRIDPLHLDREALPVFVGHERQRFNHAHAEPWARHTARKP